jgi:hypothetical protein
MADLEGFHDIHFFVSFINLVLGFILDSSLTSMGSASLFLFLFSCTKWWSDKQQNIEETLYPNTLIY